MRNFIKKFDFMHQYDDYSCGRMCAYMVTAAFGVRRNRKLLRHLLKTDYHFGTFQKDIVKSLRKFKFGCDVISFANWMPGLLATHKLLADYFEGGYLAIACVDQGNHWIVVRGVSGNRVYIADPDPNAPKYHTLTKFWERLYNGSIVFVKRKD